MPRSHEYHQPCQICAEGGLVIVEATDALAFTMTPRAAIETGQLLINAGVEAAKQRQNPKSV